MFSESIGNKGGDVPASTEHTADVSVNNEMYCDLYTVCSAKALGTKEGMFPLPPNIQCTCTNRTQYYH